MSGSLPSSAVGTIAQISQDITRSLVVGMVAGGSFGAAIPQRVLVALVIAAVLLSTISIVRATQALHRETTHSTSTDVRLDAAARTLAKAKAVARND